MFCPKCKCEFVGWTGKCPDCGTRLVKELPAIPETADQSIAYKALVDLARANGGQLEIDLSTIDVGMERKWGFPYLGYKFAWAKKMQGDFDDNLVDLTTAKVGREKKSSFPYQGYGFAWAKKMEGYIGGNPVDLTANKVGREKSYRFPYRGYGFAWTQELSGECGDQLSVNLLTTDVGRKKGWSFPYSGYGSAWADKGVLTLTWTNLPLS